MLKWTGLLLLCFAVGCGGASNQQAPPPAPTPSSLSGSWIFELTDDFNDPPFPLGGTLTEASNGQLTGQNFATTGGCLSANEIATGNLAGSALTLSFSGGCLFDGSNVDFTGTINAAFNSGSGVYTFPNDPSSGGTWTASRGTLVLVKLTITIQGDVNGFGAVGSQPSGIACGWTNGNSGANVCESQFVSGSSISLGTADQSGSGLDSFVNWGGACSGTEPTCTLTPTTDQNVIANFN